MVTGGAIRIAFFGTPHFAVPTLQHLVSSRHEVVGVVTQPDRPRGRGQKVTDSPVKAAALEHRLAVFQPDRLRDPLVEYTLAAWRPDLGVVAAYGKLIPEHLLGLPGLGMINVHASLLPRYRGAAPIHRAVIDGETETGVTIMRMVKQLDAGGMFATARRPIGPDETSDEVERDLATIGANLLLEVVEQLIDGTARETAQDDACSTYAPRLTKDEGLVDWARPATDIHNRVRGLYPWPHAFTHLNGQRLILLETRVEREPPAPAPGTAPGTIIGVSRDAVDVATGGHGRIAIVGLQPEGRRPMHVREFTAGHQVQTGTRLGTP